MNFLFSSFPFPSRSIMTHGQTQHPLVTLWQLQKCPVDTLLWIFTSRFCLLPCVLPNGGDSGEWLLPIRQKNVYFLEPWIKLHVLVYYSAQNPPVTKRQLMKMSSYNISIQHSVTTIPWVGLLHLPCGVPLQTMSPCVTTWQIKTLDS